MSAGLEDAVRRMGDDPDLVEVAGAIYHATHGGAACVILVAEVDAPTWREHTWQLPGVEIIATSLMLPGQARVKS
jgi:hypothetical protein